MKFVKNANRPAYPDPDPDGYAGLSKFELVSAMAMQGLLSNPAMIEVINNPETEDGMSCQIARMATAFAECLIDEIDSTVI